MGKLRDLLVPRAKFEDFPGRTDAETIQVAMIVGKVGFIGTIKDPELFLSVQVERPSGDIRPAMSVMFVIEEVFVMVRPRPLGMEMPWFTTSRHARHPSIIMVRPGTSEYRFYTRRASGSICWRSCMEPESKPRLRWRTVIQTVVPVSVVAIVVAGLWAFSYWNPFFPRELGRRITEGFLRAFLIGYAAILVLVLTGIAGLSWALWRSRARRPRRLVLVRGLLLCVSGLIGVMTLEASAGIWLAWAHRLPTLPTRFPESSRDEISLVVIGGSSALGYPYYPIFCTISAGEIVARELPRAWPGRRVAIDNRCRLANA